MVTAASASNVLGIVVSLAISLRLYRCSAALAGGLSRKLISIVFVAASLFLAISASDDLARFAFLNSFSGTGSTAGVPSREDPGSQSNSTQILRALDALYAALVTPVFDLAAALIASGLVTCAVARSVDRCIFLIFGRAPPVSA